MRFVARARYSYTHSPMSGPTTILITRSAVRWGLLKDKDSVNRLPATARDRNKSLHQALCLTPCYPLVPSGTSCFFMLLIRSPKRRRTVALEIEADGTLKVTAPLRTSLSWIQAFIAQKANWIAQRQKAQREKATRPALVLETGARLPFHGQTLALVLHKTDQNEAPTCWQDKEKNELHLTLQSGLSPSVEQAEIRTGLTLWYKKQARALFQSRMDAWALKMKVTPSRLILTSPRRRWGSCNAKNEIRLNWRVIMADPEVLDYLIVHELAHIPHKNHGKRFWALVARHIVSPKAQRLALRKFEQNSPLSAEI